MSDVEVVGKTYTLSQINPPLREAFIRESAVNAIWRANSFELAVQALREAMDEDGLEPAKLAARRQMLALAIRFAESSRDSELARALTHLKLWDAFRKGELDESAVIPE